MFRSPSPQGIADAERIFRKFVANHGLYDYAVHSSESEWWRQRPPQRGLQEGTMHVTRHLCQRRTAVAALHPKSGSVSASSAGDLRPETTQLRQQQRDVSLLITIRMPKSTYSFRIEGAKARPNAKVAHSRRLFLLGINLI